MGNAKVKNVDATSLIWEFRLALWLPRPLVVGAVVFVACFVAVYLSFQWIFDFRIERLPIGYGLTIGFALVVARYLACGEVAWRRQPREIQDAARHQSEAEALRLPLSRIRRSRFAGAVGVLAFAMIIELANAVSGHAFMASWLSLHDSSATMLLVLLMGWFFGRFIYLSLNSSLLFGMRGQLPLPKESDVDLLNLDQVYEFGRRGLPVALVWLAGVAIFIILSPVSWGNSFWVALPVLAVSLGVALFAALRPAIQVRNLIRAVKQEQLLQLEPLLPQARDDTLAGAESRHGRLTDLLAYRDRVESTSEWSFDSSATFRFVLYLLIPIGSMVIGAFVDRGVNYLID